QYFETSPTSAPIMGIVAALIMGVGGYFYLKWRQKKLAEQGEVFDEPKDNNALKIEGDNPHVLLSILPLITVLATLNLLDWHIIVALIAGILLILILNIHRIKGFVKAINTGAIGSVTAIINTSAAVGFGTVVQAVPGFNRLTEILLGIPGNPLI